ncbi:Zn-ribbon domain-containing OB-fold protein [Streptomyces cadmiisoli]|uniref:Zn-ribbon domain-containing OB-fold protein n=1 Tax=Streptomyces cadmiisoli TaxID=2184053 RepID=UPI00364B62C9
MSQTDFLPPDRPATAPYWDATRSRTLLLQRCGPCGQLIHHPREACPRCLAQDFVWGASTGRGSVHAVSVHHRPFEVMDAGECPYVVAFVDLDEGVRFLSNIVGADRLTASPGDRVRLVWKPVAGGHALPQFEVDRTADR